MAHFRGIIQGTRGEASRLGSKNSGLNVAACSWQGSVVVTLDYDETTGKDVATVALQPHHGAGVAKVLYRGPVGSFNPERV